MNRAKEQGMAATEQLDEEVENVEGAAPAGGGKKRLIMIVVAAVVLIGGGVGGWLMFGGTPDAKEAKDAKSGKKLEAAEKLPPHYITLDPPFVVNFEAESMVRFLQVTVGVMTREPEIEKVVKENDPRVRNDLLMILGNQTYATVSTLEGKEALRKRCLDAVRAIVKEMGGEPNKVEALYFTSFVMQ
jgi:flagellar FliL protein